MQQAYARADLFAKFRHYLAITPYGHGMCICKLKVYVLIFSWERIVNPEVLIFKKLCKIIYCG